MKTGGELNRRMQGRVEDWGLDVTDPVWEQRAVWVREGRDAEPEVFGMRPEAGIDEGRGPSGDLDTGGAPLKTEEAGWPGRGR